MGENYFENNVKQRFCLDLIMYAEPAKWRLAKSVIKRNQKHGFFMTCETVLTDSGFFEIICRTPSQSPSHGMKTPFA